MRQINSNKGAKNIVVAHKMEEQYPNVHISEWAWCNVDFDAVIENKDSVEFLKNRVLNHLASK
jgi:hypothetical protein